MYPEGVLQPDVCDSDHFGRILNYDQSGRSLRLMLFKRPMGVRQVSVLSELKVGQTAVLEALDLPESVQNHLMHMGFVPDARVTALRRAPAGDPTVYSIDGMEIALRHETAEAIRVRTPLAAEVPHAATHAGLQAVAHAIQTSPETEALELVEAAR
jgi:Fe2+ transport system protein FeoA